MTDELYLILHKVRGQPAFDIAHKLGIGDEEGWIIPTSGHRAYPYATWGLYELCCDQTWNGKPAKLLAGLNLQPPSLDWPDHYTVNASPKSERANADSLLASLGLLTKVHSAVVGKLTRRI